MYQFASNIPSCVFCFSENNVVSNCFSSDTSTLDMQEVDIIVYDFTLTKVGCLRKSTLDNLKEKLPCLQGFLDRRRTKSFTHDLESQHLLLDEENALIGTSDDDEDESPLL